MDNSRVLDQFYTNKILAKELYDYLDNKYYLKNYLLLEPSAGTGSFSDLFHSKYLAYDLDPKKSLNKILEADFLKINLKKDINCFTIGNPPFGKNASLAIKFFNKASEFSEYIAFIVPKTFKKVSIQNKLNLNFHLVEEISIPMNSFIFNEKEYSVPCVFQIWKKENYQREKINTRIESEYFEFTKKEDAHFAIRRVGGLAGKTILNFQNYSKSSHYYIKNKSIIELKSLIYHFQKEYSSLNEIAKNSAGNPSLSKFELITILNKSIGNV